MKVMHRLLVVMILDSIPWVMLCLVVLFYAYRVDVCDFGTNQCWNQTSDMKSETLIDPPIDWGSSIDQLIDWWTCSTNSELLDRSADRSSRFLSRTGSCRIDQPIDRGIGRFAPANRELWNRSLDRLAILDRSADRSRILPEHNINLNRSMDRSNSLQSIELSLNRLGSWVSTRKPCNSAPWP